MKFSIPRAGALAPAAILFVTLFGAEAGAWAQDEAPLAVEAAATATEPDAPRFFAEEVVQPLPAEESLEARVRQATSLHELVGDMPVADTLSPDM